MKAILIDPSDKTIKEVSYNGDYTKIYDFIGNECTTFACTDIAKGESIYYDDEGLYHENIGGIMMPGWANPVVGRCLVLGIDYSNGDSVGTKTTVEEVKAMVSWIDKDSPALINWFANFN